MTAAGSMTSLRASILSSYPSSGPKWSQEKEENVLYSLPREVAIGSRTEEHDGRVCVVSPTASASTGTVGLLSFHTTPERMPFSSNCFVSLWDDENSKLEAQLKKESEETFPMSDLEWKVLLDSSRT